MTNAAHRKWQHQFNLAQTPIQLLPNFKGVKIMVKRDDMNHPTIQGNKLRKLKYNIKYAITNRYETIATFGGAWSNHVLATAAAASACGLKSIGFIRGQELAEKPENWSKTLIRAQSYGMQLVFMTRQDYRLKSTSPTVQKYIDDCKSSVFTIPEGGSNDLAIKGVREIIEECLQQLNQADYIISACGTGGTLAGLIDGVAVYKNIGQVVGIPVLKGADFLFDEICSLSIHHHDVSWQLQQQYHAGGYAKIDHKTLQFAQEFGKKFHIPLDHVYTAKTFFAAYNMIEKGLIKKGSSIIILHTGGLQAGVIQ